MTVLKKGVVLPMLIVLMIALVLPAQARGGSRSFYNAQGHYSGQAINNGNGTTSIYDGSGHFNGSTIRNSDGTTSIYDGSGHFSGSTSPRR